MLSVAINMKRTGENIHNLRKQAGFSVRELSEIMGFSTSHTIYRWQNGESLPSIDSLVVLSELFGVTINEILAIDIVTSDSERGNKARIISHLFRMKHAFFYIETEKLSRFMRDLQTV